MNDLIFLFMLIVFILQNLSKKTHFFMKKSCENSFSRALMNNLRLILFLSDG